MNSTIASNGAQGSVVDNRAGTLTIDKSSINRNASDSVILFNSATMNILNSTIANSMSRFIEGVVAVGNEGTLDIRNSTISGNNASGNNAPPLASMKPAIRNLNPSLLELQNSIVAFNGTSQTGLPAADCAGVIESLGNNIIGNPDGCQINLLPTDLTGDPGLDAFIDDGAPGNGLFPLLVTSRAINAGSDSACPPTDQLDTPRKGSCDIGAIEFYPVVNDLVALGNLTTAFDPMPVPGGPAGTFRITAEFTNTTSRTIMNPFAEVVELSGGNLLINADGGAGAVGGGRLTLPNSATNTFEPGASSSVEFLIGLQKREPFTFLINILGEPKTSNSLASKR